MGMFGGVDVFNDFLFFLFIDEIDKAKLLGTSSTDLAKEEGGMVGYIHRVTVCLEKHVGNEGLGWKDEVGNIMKTVRFNCGEESSLL
jgi:hypothetical protein